MDVAGIQSLPNETIVYIISYLSAPDMDSCARVCKRFKRIMQNSLFLKYSRALKMSGFTDIDPVGTSIIDRLRKLRSHEAGWRSLHWRKKATLPLNGNFGAYEMNGGVFAYSSRDNESIVFTILSTVTDGHQPITWEHRLHPLDVMDFTFSCDQDLICLIERDVRSKTSPYKIHLRTVLKDISHPQANVPILLCPPECADYWPSVLHDVQIAFTLQVYQDLVGCLFQSSPFGGKDVAVIWNWKTGQVKQITRPPLEGRYTDMSFLSESSILICHVSECTSLKVISWDASKSKDCDIISLQLPSLQNKYAYYRIQCHSNPSPGGPHFERANSPLFVNRSFVATDDDRLLAFSTYIRRDAEDVEERERYFLFFLSQAKLQRFLAHQHSPKHSDNAGELIPTVMNWEAWGPQQARWIRDARTYGWAVCSRGMRFVCAKPEEPGPDFCSRVMLLDFRIPKCTTCEGPCQGCGTLTLPHNVKLVAGPTLLSEAKQGVFDKDLVSTLPYLEVISADWLMDSVGFMMDEETIVSMKAEDTDIIALDVMSFGGSRHRYL